MVELYAVAIAISNVRYIVVVASVHHSGRRRRPFHSERSEVTVRPPNCGFPLILLQSEFL